jgi:thioester reductase-like protein
VVIYRLGSIGATTKSGTCNKNDIHTLLLAAIIKMGCYPETALHCHFDGLPVDFTAKSIVYLSSIQPDVYGKIYHVANPTNRVAFKDIIDCLCHSDIQLEKVSYEEWRVKLKTITDRDSPFESVGEFLLDSALHEEYTLSATRFCSAVSSLNFPPLDNDYMLKWLSFISHHIVR